MMLRAAYIRFDERISKNGWYPYDYVSLNPLLHMIGSFMIYNASAVLHALSGERESYLVLKSTVVKGVSYVFSSQEVER